MAVHDLNALKDMATRPRRVVPIVLDGTVRARIEVAEQALADSEVDGVPAVEDRRLASRAPAKVAAAAQAVVDGLYAEAESKTLRVVVQGLPGTDWRALLAAHPPRRDADGKIVEDDRAGTNEETLRPELVRACVIGQEDGEGGPVVPVDEAMVTWLIGWATDLQMDRMVSACYLVCRGDGADPLAPRRRSVTRSSASE